MRRISATARSWRFALSDGEREAFESVLRTYPAIPSGHQPLSRHTAADFRPEDRHLLDEALEEQRQTHRTRLRTWLKKPGRFHRADEGWELKVSVKDVDWLLQVLNDIRVGQWIKLGSPDSLENPLALFAKDGNATILMELAGMFQMALITGMETPGSDRSAGD